MYHLGLKKQAKMVLNVSTELECMRTMLIIEETRNVFPTSASTVFTKSQHGVTMLSHAPGA
jgi:hypothetical protein